MPKMKFLIVILSCCLPVAVCAQSPNSNLKVVLIRHAEKPESGDNLSCKGFNRALQLPAVLVKQFGVPNYVYVPAPSTGKATKSGRMQQTAWLLAVKYNLAINTKFGVEQTTQLGQDVLKKTGTVVVIWEHDNIPDIVKALGGKKKNLKWPGSDFDSIWLLTITKGKPELTQAREGITPVAGCDF